jgi:signal peptidase II
MPSSRQQEGVLIPWLGLALVVVLIDQVSKITMTKLFAYGAGRVITPFFNLVLTYNTGAAFSFLAASGGWQRWFFTLLAIAAAF